jgi:KUP system potassium uptake protein
MADTGSSNSRTAGMVALTVGALGVVFGDIGTSPLYAFEAVFSAHNQAVAPTRAGVYGVISLVFWTITLIVSVKYVTLIMRADNDGEGGILALTALVERTKRHTWLARSGLVVLGIFGAALFYGDGMITPAISVLSAVEGLQVAAPSLDSLVVPISVAILVALFAVERYGTGAVARAFGPIMIVWFSVLALSGLREVIDHPDILRALSPSYGVTFFLDHGGTAFIALGSVVLTITGAEALYADMGHFGRSPIRRAWFFIVFPALTLNYMGQGALVLHTPNAIENPFFLLVPDWSRIPMVILATAATVIASQAVISGAFSITKQAVQLGFLPRMTIRHTSERQPGRVYAPAVNWSLCAAAVALIVGFQSSTHLTSAYGIAVTGTMAITTALFFYVVHALWHRPLWLVLTGAAVFLSIELTFFSATVTKVATGGWVSLVVAFAVFAILSTWRKGREITTRIRTREEGPLREFVEELRAKKPPVHRSPGTAVFLHANPETTPLALRANVEHNYVVHQSVVIVSLKTLNIPRVSVAERLVVDDVGYRDDGIILVEAKFGYLDHENVPRTLALAAEQGVERVIDLQGASYFLSRDTIMWTTGTRTMRRWRKRLFLALWRNQVDPSGYFGLPDERTVTMGSVIEL